MFAFMRRCTGHTGRALVAHALSGVLLILAACSDGTGGGSSHHKGNIALIGDSDADGLRDEDETAGWTIRVDRTGYGMRFAEAVFCTSDPHDPDTDGDGLLDGKEFEIRSNPRAMDTDGDLLRDDEEWLRWLTNPSSVDTDGDARGVGGNLAPNAALFDGQELSSLHTSPTLVDTDGDARWDCEEYDSPVYSPLIAELPMANFHVDGEVDVRLRVEYADKVGEVDSYGSSMKIDQVDREHTSVSTTHQSHVGMSFQAGKTGLSFKAESSYDFEHRKTFDKESRRQVTQESQRYKSESRESTEVTTAGQISLPLQVENTGLSTFELNNLIVTVLHWSPGQRDPGDPPTGTFKAMATLRPQVESITLAPGERTPILEISNQDVNAAVVKEFLAQPSSMILQPAMFDLSNQEGIDFDFLTESTFQRTALVELDFGNRVETYRVATNVWREPDSSFSGVTMQEVMTQILGVPYAVNPVTGKLNEVDGLGESVSPEAFWAIIGSRDEHTGATLRFEDVVLKGGDQMRLVLVSDVDGDGLYAFEENFYGTRDDSEADSDDTDGDNLSDSLEIKEGWLVADVGPRVYSDPLLEDADGDGFCDEDEYLNKTDPTDPDTDGDGLTDDIDPYPTTAAGRLYVDNTPGDSPAEWPGAYSSLHDAIEAADAFNTDGNEFTDVSQIWVARGTYAPSDILGFRPSSALGLYGGFWGGETKRSVRDSDPQTNQTELSNPTPGSEQRIVTLDADQGVTLDGFLIQGGLGGPTVPTGAGVYVLNGTAVLANLLFYDNHTDQAGGGGALHVGNQSGVRGRTVLRNCTFIANTARCQDHVNGKSGGGALYCAGATPTDLTLEDCQFLYNETHVAGGAIKIGSDPGTDHRRGQIRMDRCSFFRNKARRGDEHPGINGTFEWIEAGAVFSLSSLELTDCDFLQNSAEMDYGSNRYGHTRGGAIVAYYPNNDPQPDGSVVPGHHDLVNCRLIHNKVDNQSTEDRQFSLGGAVYATLMNFTNSTVAYNQAVDLQPSDAVAGGVLCLSEAQATNSIFWGNVHTYFGGKGWEVRYRQQIAEVYVLFGDPMNYDFYAPKVEFSCVQDGAHPEISQQFANLWADPKFVDADLNKDDVHLLGDSPCIDAGLNIVDIHPKLSGRYPMPETDLDGNPRIDSETVDMGAYEVPQGGP